MPIRADMLAQPLLSKLSKYGAPLRSTGSVRPRGLITASVKEFIRMQVRNPEVSDRKARVSKESASREGNVYSLANARRRRETRAHSERIKRTPDMAVYDAIDLTGVDLDRLTPGARQLYWYNLTNHARFIFASASDGAMRDKGIRDAPISTDHVQDADDKQIGNSHRREAEFGMGFVLDALQILGAATCGALATRPMALEGAGPWPLVAALTATVFVFVAREHLYSRCYN